MPTVEHRLAARKAIRLRDIASETYITLTRVAPALKAVIEEYAARPGVTLKPDYDTKNLSSAVPMMAAMGGVTLGLPWRGFYHYDHNE